MIDPRHAVVERRLDGVSRIVAVTGGKGGIGKTMVSASLAACLARSGCRAGLLDLDFTGPCCHIVLGAEPVFPSEDFGILPQVAGGVHFMSVTCFTGEDPAPLRGADVSSALVELLAITRWGDLDFLVIDMPPGLGDATLEAARLLPRAEYLVVSTASRMVVDTVRRTLNLLRRLDCQVLGVVENMSDPCAPDGLDDPPCLGDPGRADAVAALAAQWQAPHLGALPLDRAVEAELGQPQGLLGTAYGQALCTMTRDHLLDQAPTG